MRKILAGIFAAAGVLGLTATAQAGAGCDGVASLDVASEESAPMSTPADDATVATDSTTKPIIPTQSGG